MTYFKLSNCIFDLGLRANELTVLAYLCSIQKPEHQGYVIAKHDTIAAACGYASRDSVQGVIRCLADKGFVSIVPRYDRFTGVTLANGYTVHLPMGGGYFKVDRQRFRAVTARAGTTAAAIYLYILRCMSNTRVAFPSLTRIRDAVHLTIATIVKKIRELQEHLLLQKQNRRKQDGSFTHNLYALMSGETAQKRREHVVSERVLSTESLSIPSKGIASCLYLKARSIFCQGGKLKCKHLSNAKSLSENNSSPQGRWSWARNFAARIFNACFSRGVL